MVGQLVSFTDVAARDVRFTRHIYAMANARIAIGGAELSAMLVAIESHSEHLPSMASHVDAGETFAQLLDTSDKIRNG